MRYCDQASTMSVDNGSPAVHRRGYRPPGGESTVQLTWSEVPDVPRTPTPVRYNATNDSHAFIAACEESPVPKPTIRMHQVFFLTRTIIRMSHVTLVMDKYVVSFFCIFVVGFLV